jgi:hypothetical protein
VKEVYSSKEVAEAMHRITATLASIRSHDAGRFVVRVSGRPVIHTRMQSLFNLKFASVLDRTLYELLMTHATAAEKLGPGGFNRSLELLLEKLATGECGNHRPTISPRVATVGDVASIVDRHASAGGLRVAAMVREALLLAGFGGRIIVEKTSSNVPSVELVRGYTFELQQLLPVDVSFVNPRVTCIDGYIESVSEVHHLLEAAASAKEPCIVFLRGASEDVKHTLKVNYDRGSLRVVPVGVRFDLEGMNTLVDLATVTGCDLVSSLKGDLISSIKFELLPYVDQVTVFRGRVVVTNPSTHRKVAEHVSQLRKRRADEKIDDVGRLLDMRIKSLSPNHVVIRLPDDKDFVTGSQAIDYALRAVRSAIDYGVTEEGQPVTTELASQVHVSRCLETLSSVGAYLA